MSTDFTLGIQLVSLGVLAILMIAIIMRKKRDAELDLLLSTTVLLMGSVALRIVSWGCERGGKLKQIPAVDAFALALLIASLVPLVVSLFLEGSRLVREVPWRRILAAITPLWLAGFVFAAINYAHMLYAAPTLSLLIVYFIYLQGIEDQLVRDSKSIERQRSVLLQEQMRPHFLFNSLAAIRELCDSDPALASTGIDNLSGYLRSNLDALAESQLIPFAKELEHIEQYVALERLNPTNNFEVVYDLQILDFLVPALSIQPLVENAILHGVRGLEEDGMVIVSTDLQGHTVRVVVEDNGPGMSPDMPQQQQQRASRGLENVRERLAYQCNGSLHINYGPEGTRMVVLVPQGGKA